MRRAALDDRIGADVLRHGAEQAEEIDAEMLEEAAVLGRQHRLDDMVGHLVDRHGIALDDAALADLVAVAVEEGDGEIVLRAPVAGGLLEGGQRERQHDDRAGGAQRDAFAEQLDDAAPPAGDAEAAEEDRQVFPDLAGLEAALRRAWNRSRRRSPAACRPSGSWVCWLDAAVPLCGDDPWIELYKTCAPNFRAKTNVIARILHFAPIWTRATRKNDWITPG